MFNDNEFSKRWGKGGEENDVTFCQTGKCVHMLLMVGNNF